MQVDIVYGMDGTGGVNKWNGLSAARSDFSDHLLYAGMAMTGIRLGEPILPSLIDHPKPYPIIYQVPTPSSTDNERPLVLVSGGEKDPILDEITAKWDQDYHELCKIFEVTFEGQKLFFKANMELTQLDGKIRKRLEGRGSAHCLFCTNSKKDTMNLAMIEAGFEMDIDNQTLLDTYNEVKKKSLIGTVDGRTEYYIDMNMDVRLRKGLSREPMLIHFDVMNNLPPLHAKLRSLSFFETIIIRIGANWLTYHEATEHIKPRIKEVENLLREESKMYLHHTIYGCQTDTGPVANVFFGFELRDQACRLFHCEDEDKVTAFRTLLQRFSIIIRVYGSNELINLPRFEEFLRETYILLVTMFDKIEVTPTVHALLGHAAEMVKRNDGRGLGNKGEQALEASMKKLKRTREHGSRKNSMSNSHQDIVNKMWVASLPRCRDFRQPPPCTFCKRQGHNIRSCPERSTLKPIKELTPDDEIVLELILTDALEDGVPASAVLDNQN